MSIPGRLTSIVAAVTDSTGNSISGTVPASGGPAVGDLLLVACAMASGSRTFAISGGGGAWNSLGAATQSGHGSQVWWRLATAGDLGSTVTVTPSTGAIKQVLLISYVSGVDQTSPLGSPTAAASNTGASSTTHTTPSVGSVASGSREVSLVFDSRGAASPQTALWTPPAAVTRQVQVFTTGSTQGTSGACGDTAAAVSGTVGSRAWTADQAAFGSGWTLAALGTPVLAAAAWSGAAGFAAGATASVPSSAALAAGGGVAAAGSVTVFAAVALSGASVLSAPATLAVSAAAGLSAVGGLSAVARVEVAASAGMSAIGGVSAGVVVSVPAQASLVASGGFAAVAVVAVFASCAAAGGSSLSASAGLGRVLVVRGVAGAGTVAVSSAVAAVPASPSSSAGTAAVATARGVTV